ncbi:NADPH-dependent FMN reductase [Robiginitalea sp. SC105]|uniref:NADPH-dependent FMN reductase n=1 Tax=Robiginitalea sp. SC105 TaxID=2762332 RepID=UPI00163A4CD1|nr:NAD(P)H-dependent oxidoreductase [Robiginitalea sp. SC105]MBC2840434.1 NAD(P)H-dependent oxidoreductase [Robiginitalea sp. SC105]
MADILATAGSNSSTSINLQLVRYTASLITGHPVEVKDLAREAFPMYSEDLERTSGFPAGIEALHKRLGRADGLILSVNEHNSNPSAFTKNMLDWLSRIDRAFLKGLPVLLLSTSGGKRGGQSSREVIAGMLPRFGADLAAEFSLPSFYETFDAESGILDPGLREAHQKALEVFLRAL